MEKIKNKKMKSITIRKKIIIKKKRKKLIIKVKIRKSIKKKNMKMGQVYTLKMEK